MQRKLGINTDCLRGETEETTVLSMAHEIGFECFTTGATSLPAVSALKNKAEALGMDFPFLHAPFRGINAMWLEGDDYLPLYEGMTTAIDSAAACGVSAVITHVSSGWQAPPVCDLGLSRYDALVAYAEEKGVALAFENLRMVAISPASSTAMQTATPSASALTADMSTPTPRRYAGPIFSPTR